MTYIVSQVLVPGMHTSTEILAVVVAVRCSATLYLPPAAGSSIGGSKPPWPKPYGLWPMALNIKFKAFGSAACRYQYLHWPKKCEKTSTILSQRLIDAWKKPIYAFHLILMPCSWCHYYCFMWCYGLHLLAPLLTLIGDESWVKCIIWTPQQQCQDVLAIDAENATYALYLICTPCLNY